MIDSTPRYAVYFLPEDDSALAAFGRWWFARAAETPRYGRLPDLVGEGLGAPRQWDIVAAARRYGFHATLKAPFRLAPSHNTAELTTAAAQLAGRTRAFTAAPLRLGELDGFLALRPGGDESAINNLAEDCVRAFDRFRAAATPAETARRLNGGLSARQTQLLAEWGYPFVFDQYRFHMTLTAPLAEEEHGVLLRILAPRVRAIEDEPLQIASFCLCVQEQPGRPFSLLQRFRLAA